MSSLWFQMLAQAENEEPGVPDVLNAFAQRMKAWDESLYDHALAAAALSSRVAGVLQLTPKESFSLVAGALLHDMGKILWPPEMSYKSRLEPSDMVLVHTHPASGCRHVQLYWPDVPQEVLAIIRQHHERPDGSGYPLGLKGKEIHPLAEVICAIEAYVAMTEFRSYRPRSFTSREALSELACTGHRSAILQILAGLAENEKLHQAKAFSPGHRGQLVLSVVNSLKA